MRRCSGRPRDAIGSHSTAGWAPRSTGRLSRLGYASLADWAGVENLEERVDGENAIDPVVLEELRRRS